ncbi:MAG TPA: phage tail tip lysozyme [Acidimicrobiia bacterium]|jgi:LysM repeat protein|nr:phage tail tip lysozyme [Acidimicrobiia bacterium]
MEHVVQSGETLKTIAAAYGTTVAQMIAANPDLEDPDRIAKNQVLQIPSGEVASAEEPQAAPGDTTTTSYTVQSGDTLKAIAASHDVTLTAVIAANPDIEPDNIRRGQVITIPAATATAGSPPRGTTSNRPAPKPRPPRRTPGGRDWSTVHVNERMVYVMERLVEYGYPVNGSAGVLGNLYYESGVLPNRIEGSNAKTPMRAPGFDGKKHDFSPEEVMRRKPDAEEGPRKAGIGLAQWTAPPRRRRLFEHEYDGRVLGAAILSDMDAQIDFLVEELRSRYRAVEAVVSNPKVRLNDACDEVLYSFETPGSVIGNDGKRLPRTDPAVETVFLVRRKHARRARRLYLKANPA